MQIAIVVAWDGQHPEWLEQALTSIDAQRPEAIEKCLVIDGVNGPVSRPSGLGHEWVTETGRWNDPAAARNEGMRATTAPWLVFWDADNVMPQGFLDAIRDAIHRAPPEIGVVYSDIEYVDEHLRNGRVWTVPEFDYWALRAGNYIDTASVWRRMAVELSGGWPEGLGSYEDYALALEMTRRGWKGQRRGGPPIVMRVHRSSRTQKRIRSGQRERDLWPVRSLGIVSLLAGRTSTYERWERFLHKAELPRQVGLYLVDNSADAEFGRRVKKTAQELATARDFDHVTVLPRATRYDPADEDGYFYRPRHLRIAQLYAEVLPTVTEDLLLTLEDDVEPPPDAIRRLTEQLGGSASRNCGALAGAYDMNDGVLCAGRADGGWGSRIPWSEVGNEPIDVGSVGGGCTVWANWALAAHPITFRWQEGLGWDGSLCADLRARGYRIQVHGGVRCVHHLHGVVRQ